MIQLVDAGSTRGVYIIYYSGNCRIKSIKLYMFKVAQANYWLHTVPPCRTPAPSTSRAPTAG